MNHFCEYDAHTNGSLGIETCGDPAVANWQGKWQCDDHLDSMQAHAGLMVALKEFEEGGLPPDVPDQGAAVRQVRQARA